jgi:hypothetical protein
MIETLRTLEEVEKAVFQALKDVGIPYEDEFRTYDENDIQEMRRDHEGYIGADVMGALTLTLREDFYVYVDLIAGPGMDIIAGEETSRDDRNGRNVKVEVVMDEWDTFEMTRWSCKKEIDEIFGYVAALWRHRCGEKSSN